MNAVQLFGMLSLVWLVQGATKRIHLKNDRCQQCRQFYGDAVLNVSVFDLATPANFENFILDECSELHENAVGYADFCFEMFQSKPLLIRQLMLRKISGDALCAQISYC